MIDNAEKIRLCEKPGKMLQITTFEKIYRFHVFL